MALVEAGLKCEAGDFVFAYLRGHPTWPSIVREVNGTRVLVDFICPEQTWLVQLIANKFCLVLFSMQLNKYLSLKSFNYSFVMQGMDSKQQCANIQRCFGQESAEKTSEKQKTATID